MTDSPIKVIDDFLPGEIFGSIAQSIMRSPTYTCLTGTSMLAAEDDGSIEQYGENEELAARQKPHEAMMHFQLYSRLYHQHTVADMWLILHDLFKELQLRLDCKTMWLARVNMTTACAENYVSAFHVDQGDHPRRDHMHASILYLNTNNGGTKFEDGTFVKSQSNRVVTFPMHIRHAGVWCTDRKLRFVLNLNYEKNGQEQEGSTDDSL